MASHRPIGFFDSGLGGVSVLREAVRLLPHENFIYYGDDAHAPYGSRPEQEIRMLSLQGTDYLADRSVKAIVVACNTATSIAVNDMRSRYNFPVISIEPAVKPAADECKTGTIAVLATPATLRQERFLALIDRIGVADRVRLVACADLAGLIETVDLDSPQLRMYVRSCISELTDAESVDALVMGCTHYSFVSPIIQQEARRTLRGACQVFDGAAGTARQLRHVLAEKNILSDRLDAGCIEFISSGGQPFERSMRKFFARGTMDASPERIDIERSPDAEREC